MLFFIAKDKQGLFFLIKQYSFHIHVIVDNHEKCDMHMKTCELSNI